MFTHFKQHWRTLWQAPPGQRFVRRYEANLRTADRRSLIRRVLLIGLALLLTAIGFVLMFIPGPAVLFFFAAGALFAEESRVVARLLDWAELRSRALWAKLRDWWSRRSFSGKGAVLAGATVLASASVYFTYRMLA